MGCLYQRHGEREFARIVATNGMVSMGWGWGVWIRETVDPAPPVMASWVVAKGDTYIGDVDYRCR